MRVYSATEAIGPAWEHTVRLLWRPRRIGTLLKMCSVALLAELATSGLSGRLPASSRTGTGLSHPSPFLLALLSGIVLLSLLLGLALFYVASRMQLVLFDLVARRSTLVAPSWHYYGSATWRWIGVKLLVFASLLVVAVPIFLPLGLSLLRGFGLLDGHHGGIGAIAGGLSEGAFVRLLIIFLPLAILFALLSVALYWLARDFALPSLALEDVSIPAAIGRVRDLLRFDGRAVFGYLLLRLALGIAASIVTYLAVGFAALLSALPLVLVGYAVWLPLHRLPAGRVLAWTVAATLGFVWVVWALVLLVVGMGTLLVFYQAWSMYFLGSRYPLLGNLLEPPIAVPVWTPPPSLPSDDDDSGSDLPMNPVPA